VFDGSAARAAVAVDLADGLAGADRLNGGAGAEQFRFVTSAEGTDTLVRFVSGTDKLVVVAANFGPVAGAAVTLAMLTNKPSTLLPGDILLGA
jgi:Ca2+-binding RTX toxin-like protein